MAEATSLLVVLQRLSRRGLQELAIALGLPPVPGRPTADSLPSGIPAASEPPSPVTDRTSSEQPPAADAAVAGTTWVEFLPRDPQWAYIHWQIGSAAYQQAQAGAAAELCLRVIDVTGLAGDAAAPRALQEVVVDSQGTEWYLPVPLSDRDYRVELGYRIAATGGWTSLAFSAAAHMPAAHPSERLLDTIEPFSFQADAADGTADGRLHERIYQRASAVPLWYGRSSEALHEGNRPRPEAAGQQASGVGRWASGRHQSGAGAIPPRQRSFWLMADAELLIYGATDPAATLTMSGEPLPLSEDGTFRIQVPFPDGLQSFPIAALAADGQQRRRMTMIFQRHTHFREDNLPGKVRPDWF